MIRGAKWVLAGAAVGGGAVRKYAAARRARGAWCRVLRFHRVIPDDEPASYYRLGLPASQFEAIARGIAHRVRVIALAEYLARRGAGSVPEEDCAVLTFDDGYLDNRTQAARVLKALGLPATFYIASACLRERAPFWPEVLSQLLRRAPAGTFDVPLAGKEPLRLALGEPERREAACLGLIRTLRTLSSAEIAAAVAAISRATGVDLEAARAASPPVMRRDDLRALIADGFSIGSHTVTHPFLPAEPEEVQRDELVRSRRELEEAIDGPILDFCYPGGGLDERTPALVAEAGYRSALTTAFGIAGQESDPMRIPRVGVGEGLARRPGGGLSLSLLEAETSGWMSATLRGYRGEGGAA